jgi:muramoyltetrapeptide carboxypeptidase
LLNFRMMAAMPKVLIGYSDVTALLVAIQQRCGLVTFHGPVAVSEMTDFTAQNVLRMLMEGGPQTLTLSPEEQKWGDATYGYRVYQPGVATGVLSGGNLTLLAALAGTPWQWNARGKLAFMEDIDERPYRVDRMLVQLQQSAGLDEAAGLAFGVLSGCHPKPGESSLSLHETLEGHTTQRPAAYGCSIGHVSNQWTIPLGVRATLDTDARVIRLLESPLSQG